jgi:hypothetical protein
MVDAAVATYEKGQKTVGESYHGAMRKAIEAAMTVYFSNLGRKAGLVGGPAKAAKMKQKALDSVTG